ncbi:hypothetical protein BCR44DRAFT_1514847 [Catenaria anguillulae PL171]|uniref:Uncharacterized protein n=1 Tax=Catenaria anguillulae PL171 TaxID=765915 RepID=A0A1Y2HFB5_9FUNG|nr:hypothetical protein BCR44DRAFT_1514847 [Catenaria anguillulae PL171]
MALKFAAAWTQRDSEFDKAFVSFAKDMESRRTLEHQAAIRIQVTWRKYAMREWRKYLDQQATTIQRMYRSHLSRIHTLHMLRTRATNALAAYHHLMATRIQALFRGHLSRKHIFDYYARKRYLAQLERKSEQVRAQLDAYERTQRLVFAEESKQKVKERQAKVARKVHHLLGTYSVPGVLAPAERRPPPRADKHPALHVHRPLSPTVRAKLPPRWMSEDQDRVREDQDLELGIRTSSPVKQFGRLSPALSETAPSTAPPSPAPLGASKMYLSTHSDLMVANPNTYSTPAPTLSLGRKEMRLLALAERVLSHERDTVKRVYAEEVIKRATRAEIRSKYAPETRLGRFGKLAPLVGGQKALVVVRAVGEEEAERMVPAEWRERGAGRGSRREREMVV